MNVVPLFGKAMIAKSSRKEMSPMIVPFFAIRVWSGGISTAVSCFCVNFILLELGSGNGSVLCIGLFKANMITSAMSTRYVSETDALRPDLDLTCIAFLIEKSPRKDVR